MTIQIFGLHNSGTNLLTNIINHYGHNLPNGGSTIIWKHTIMEEEIENIVNDDNNKVFFVIRDPFFWFLSHKKTNYLDQFYITKNEKIFKRKINFPLIKLLHEEQKAFRQFESMIDLFNEYNRIYNKFKTRKNCLLLKYSDIIHCNRINDILSHINVSVTKKNVESYKAKLNYKSKRHGNPRTINEALKYIKTPLTSLYSKEDINFINKNLNYKEV